MAVEKIKVPDLGGADEVEVIEVLVSQGDEIGENDSMITLESDKAATEIPAPKGGKVKEVLVKVGDKLSEGADILVLEVAGDGEESEAESEAPREEEQEDKQEKEPSKAAASAGGSEAKADKSFGEGKAEGGAPAREGKAGGGAPSVQEVKVPDMGGADDVEVIDVLVSEGDEVAEEDGLITVETDKASMDVPSPVAGKVKSLKVKQGDTVSEGSLILEMEVAAAEGGEGEAESEAPAEDESQARVEESGEDQREEAPQGEAGGGAPTARKKEEGQPREPASVAQPPKSQAVPKPSSGDEVYAGPAVRKLARELGVDLKQVSGSGTKGRVVKEDVQEFVKARMQGGAETPAGGLQLPAIPDIDFSKFGEIEEVEMSKLHQVTARNMSQAWLSVPHVTQFDEADVTELEEFRAGQKKAAEKKGVKLTPLAFIIKACAKALREHPQFNVSLHPSGKKLIRKNYVHIGVAVATPAGLMVPVLRDADKKTIWEIAAEVIELSDKAKNRKLKKEDMEGACFTVSSLGGIGGSGFTPIVNSPEVGILGVSKTTVKPVWRDGDFEPRQMMPFSLSYDHRAVNGVDGGQFCTYLSSVLSDIRLLLM